MTGAARPQLNPKLDLVLQRTVDVPPELVWKCWTTPEHLMKWFTPVPWKTVECEIDLRPGGQFHAMMQSPEGENFPNSGCYLDIVPNRRLVWTSALGPGFRPQPKPTAIPFFYTAIIELEADGTGTKYTATCLHSDEDSAKKHDGMGFHDGWGKAWEQLVAVTGKL